MGLISPDVGDKNNSLNLEIWDSRLRKRKDEQSRGKYSRETAGALTQLFCYRC